MRLIIVESPAKCQKIQGFLGAGNRVIASMGHIRALAHDIKAVGLDNGFEPIYEFMKEKSKAIAQLKAAAKDATSVILCSDDDREGEAIAYSIAVLLKLNPKTNPRAAFREITRNAVLDAISKPRLIDMNKVYSQQARAMLDMMVGFTVSPILWKHIGYSASSALSAGRCQTPALRLVCEKEQLIESFKSECSWMVKGSWSAAGCPKEVWDAAMIDMLGDDESALNYLENHSTEQRAKITSAMTKSWTEGPPQPLMTSTLQQQASNLYHFAPKRTMQIAQKLYESGHITYMRTDQTTMSEEAVEDAKRVVESKWGKPYVAGQTAAPKKKKAEVQAQEAHEAIRPTHFDVSKLPDSEDWGTQDYKVYRLIWLRAIQSIMSHAKGETRTIRFDAAGDEGEFPWHASWKRTIFPGWKTANDADTELEVAEKGDEAKDKDDELKEDLTEQGWRIAEKLDVGKELLWQMLKAQPKESKPQGRYTEASLVRELEKKGIGRPSTFASLIATLVEKAYVEVTDIPAQTQDSKIYSLLKLGQWPPASEKFVLKKGGEKARMVPTPLGKTLMDFTLKHFPDLFAFQFTAGMEGRLDKIAEGVENWKLVLGDTWNSYKDRITELKTAGTGTPSENPKRREFAGGIIAVMSGKGPLLLKEGATKEETVFYGWPTTIKRGFTELTQEEARAFVTSVLAQKQGDTVGDWNGHSVVKKKGPYGFYAEWNGLKVNLVEGDTLETIVVKIRAKQENPTRTVGPFQIKTGPYGPYLMKAGQGAKGKPQYVSIPKETNIESLTAQQAGEIFEAGLKAKSNYKKFKKT
jgi:DNA topoisomerase-1